MTKEVGAQQYFVCQRRCGQRYSIYLLLKCKQGQQTSDGLLESVRQSQPRSKGEKKREKGIRLVLMLSVNFCTVTCTETKVHFSRKSSWSDDKRTDKQHQLPI
jgi:hypothetical protein